MKNICFVYIFRENFFIENYDIFFLNPVFAAVFFYSRMLFKRNDFKFFSMLP